MWLPRFACPECRTDLARDRHRAVRLRGLRPRLRSPRRRLAISDPSRRGCRSAYRRSAGGEPAARLLSPPAVGRARRSARGGVADSPRDLSPPARTRAGRRRAAASRARRRRRQRMAVASADHARPSRRRGRHDRRRGRRAGRGAPLRDRLRDRAGRLRRAAVCAAASSISWSSTDHCIAPPSRRRRSSARTVSSSPAARSR